MADCCKVNSTTFNVRIQYKSGTREDIYKTKPKDLTRQGLQLDRTCGLREVDTLSLYLFKI